MSFCTECGKKLSENSPFCTECGSPQEEKKQSEKPVEAKKIQKKPLSRKKKMSLIISGVLVVCLIGAHFIITSIIDPVNQVQAMDRAISEGKTEDFYNEIHLDQSALIHKEDYFQYIKENGWEDLRYQLAAMAESDEAFDTTVRDGNGNKVFVVKKNALIPGLYYTYDIEAIPSKLIVSSNIQKATIAIDKQSIAAKNADEEMTFGKIYPGQYNIVGKASNSFGEFTAEETADVKAQGDEAISFPIEFSGSSHPFYTNIPESTLFINGKSTKKTLSEYDQIGPIPDEQDVKLHAEWKDDEGKTYKTESINQDGDVWGTLDFEFEVEDEPIAASTTEEPAGDSEEMEDSESAENHVLSFRLAYEEALNSKDYSLIVPFLLKESPADKELKKYIGDLEDKGYSYEFTENTITGTENTGENTFIVSTNEIFIFTNHLNEQTHYDREKTYTVIDTEDGYKITEINIKDTDRNDL